MKCLQDLAFYGLGLNNTIVLQLIGFSSGPTLYDVLYNNAVGMIILTCAGSIPGYWVAVLTVDTLGRKPLQLFGFLALTVIFCVLGFDYFSLSEAAMLTLYVAAQFFFNWGPNTTTFIVPGECFPTRYRSTGHGLSAASGKIGAIVAQVLSIPLLNKDAPPNCSGSACSPWLNRLMQLFALFMLCGFFSTFLIPETKGITLEELAGEAPTSYNAGRNGSIAVSHRTGWSRWNPFAGGQPAGFSYPRAGYHHGRGWTSRNPRMGIMTSPELAVQQTSPAGGPSAGGAGAGGASGGKGSLGRGASLRMHKKPTRKKERGTSSESNEYALSMSSGGDDSMLVAPAAVLPGWGAGWGSVDRAGPMRSAAQDNIRLEDVGRLLK